MRGHAVPPLEIADDPQKARVTFAAHYGPLSPSTGAPSLASGIAGGFSEVMMVAAPSKFRLHKGGKEPVYGYHRVRVEFEASITAHFTEIVPEAFSPYDWSGGPLNLEELGVDRYVERFRELWSETSRCPNPRMYEVLGVPEDQDFRRWLIQGEEFQVEVVAMDWRWELGQPLRGW